MLLHVALSHLGIWSVFDRARASVGRTSLSVAQVVGIIAVGFALRLRSIEGFKTALRRDFGYLLGLPLILSLPKTASCSNPGMVAGVLKSTCDVRVNRRSWFLFRDCASHRRRRDRPQRAASTTSRTGLDCRASGVGER
jgi:hypothetical protein